MDNEDKLRRALLNDEFPDSEEFYNNQAFSVAPENRLKFERNAAVAAWMTGAAGREVLPTGTDWQSNKDALAQGFFKIPTAKDMSDESIHDLIRSHIQTSDNTTNLALESALSGRPLPQALSELHALTGVAKTRGIRDRYMNAASGIYGSVAAKVTPYRGLINEAAGVLGEKMRAEDQPLGEMTDAFNSVAEKLVGVPEQDRRLVIEAIAATGGTTAEERSSYLSKMGARVNRIAETMGAAVMSNASTFGKVLEAFPSGLANKPDEVAAIMQEDTKNRELVLLAQQIRTAAADKLDPVKGNSWLQNQGLSAAEMATQSSIALANPIAAFGANLAYFRDTIGADAMTQNPGMTVEQSDKISAVAAPVNAAIETVTALIPWGKVKLPALQKWLMSETASVGGAARNFGIRAITGTGAEIGEEWLQAYAPLKAQELMSGLKQDMPSVDWEKNMPKFADIAAEVWAPALLFSLVGGGVASINDIKNGRSLAADLDMLVAKGVAPETAAKIKEASDAGDYNKVDSLFRAEFASETKASKPDIQAATERLKARFKAQENVEALTETTSPEYTASVTRTPSGWQVTTGDGTIIPAETAEGANQIYNGLRQVGSQQEANVIAEVLDTYFESGMGRGAKVEMTGEDVEANRGGVFAIRRDANNVKVSERPFGPQALETVRAEAEIAGIKAGASGVIGRINGLNEIFGFRVADTVKAVWRKLSLFKSSKEGNPQIFTLLHEDIESKFSEGLRDGTWSEEDARTAFRALAPAFVDTVSPIKSAEEVAAMSEAQRRKYESELEDRKLEYRWIENVRKLAAGEGNYTMLQETFSEMYVRDRFAKDRRGKDIGFKPMQISRALEAAVVGANTNEEASALKRILAMFRAFSAHMKAVFGTVKAMVKARDNGTIGEDWDAFVDKVLGIDEVKRDEGLAADEVKAFMEDSDMPFKPSPFTAVLVPTSYIDTIPEDLARAEADMKAGGKDWAAKVDLSQPVGVYRGEDGRLKLFDGHHRWIAARERGEPLQVRESVFGRAVPIGEARAFMEDSDMPFSISPVTGNNLVTVHNLSENNLRHALKVGGLAVPSLAVVRTDVSNFDAFGEITLIARPNLVDPQRNKDSKVFNADVYSPRYPTVKTIFSRRELDKVGPLFKGYYDELEKITKKSYSWSVGNLVETLADEGFDRLQSNHLVQYAYLRDAGLIEAPSSEMDGYDFGDLLRKQTNELRTEIVNFVQSKVDSAGVKYEEKIPDGYTNSGKRKFLPHDLDTVVKIMTRKLKDGEGFNYGVPSIRAANAKPFKTLKAIQDSRDKIITSEEMEALKKEVNDEFIVLAESALAARETKPSFGGLDAVSDDMKALVQGDNSWIREMYGDSPVVQDMKTFVAKLRDMPTEYFEAKVKRAVQLQEFEAAVVPSGTSEDLKAALKKKGIAVREYEAGNGASRKSAIESASSEFNATFSISPIRNLNELSDQVERQFKENPVGALDVKSRMIRQFAKYADKWSQERWTPQGNKIRPISEKRTVKSLDKEQAMRQAQREVELVNEGMDNLTPETLMAYSEGVGVLEDDPLVDKMLNDNGRLMSKATAAREGRNIKDQYDDLNWIPPQWYSNGRTIKTVVITRKDGSSESFPSAKVPAEVKAAIKSGEVKVKINKVTIPAVGGIMPDVMANNLGFDTASEMWAALESSIKSHRNAKEGYAKAEAAVKAVEKAAFEQARKEAQAWRDEADAMQKEDWSPKESLVRDLITLEAIVAMFPAEIRGKIGGFVTLARKASESARLKVLQKQLERGQVLLEKHLKEQYGTATDKLLDRYKSQKDASGRITGKILSTATEQVDWAAAVMDMTIEQQSEKSDVLEKIIEEPKDGDDVQDALNRLGILRLFEVWDTKDSAAREAAFNWLAETIEMGKQGKKILDEERKAFLTDMRQSAQSSILKGDKLNPAVADNITNLNKGVLKSALLRMRGILSSSLWTTMQRLELIFGEDSKVLNHFAEKIINAANLSTDIKRLVEAQKKEALSIIFNSDSKFAHARGIAELQKMKQSKVFTRKVEKKEVKLDLETLTKLNDGTMSAETAGLRQDEADAALEEFANNGRKSSVTIEQVVDAGEPVERTMSETQGIQWWLWSMQEASRKQMERDGWDADSFTKLEAFLSPEAKALGRWISNSYNVDAPALIDPVYRKILNAPLPRTKNYAPMIRRNMNTGGDIMDMEASDISSGLAAGFVKARVNTTASLVESDALAVFLAYWENLSHWVSHAELMRDMKGVLLDKNTAVAIRQKKSEGYLQRLKEDIKTIESNGTNSARELVDISRMWRWFMQFRAYKGLAFRISPIIKQTPALLNPLLADVPAHNYMMGMARAFMEPQAFAKEVSAMWSSDIIRRRIESGFSAESRVAMQGSSMTGSQAILVMQAGMMPMSMVDGGWTALGAAISFDYYRRGYMRDNPQMTPEIADAKAIARVEKMIATSAQPSDVYARSLFERSSEPFKRGLAMFVSDQRKTLAIELMAIRKLATGKSKNKALDIQRAIVAHFVMAAVSQTAAVVVASLLGDDEDRDREWSAEQWTLALALGPVNGLFVLGRLFDRAGRYFINSDFYQERFGTGQKLGMFPNDNLADKAFVDIYKAVNNMDDLFDPENPDDFMDELDNISSAVGASASAVFGPAGAVIDVGANLVREGRKVAKRVTE